MAMRPPLTGVAGLDIVVMTLAMAEENPVGIDGRRIDQLLQQAVDGGAVPHVAAIAADRNGVVYEGGAGTPASPVRATTPSARPPSSGSCR